MVTYSRSLHYNIDRIFDDFHFNIRERTVNGVGKDANGLLILN